MRTARSLTFIVTILLLASCSVPQYPQRALRYDRREPSILFEPEVLATLVPEPVMPYVPTIPVPEFTFPLDSRFHVSSHYGTRKQVIKGMGGEEGDFHRGVDLVAPRGTRILAAASGTVLMHYPPPSRVYKGHPVFGGMIVLRHPHGFYTVYGHMSQTFVREGQAIEQGQEIGVIGNTGRSTGLHLHFEIGFDPMLFFENTP